MLACHWAVHPQGGGIDQRSGILTLVESSLIDCTASGSGFSEAVRTRSLFLAQCSPTHSQLFAQRSPTHSSPLLACQLVVHRSLVVASTNEAAASRSWRAALSTAPLQASLFRCFPHHIAMASPAKSALACQPSPVLCRTRRPAVASTSNAAHLCSAAAVLPAAPRSSLPRRTPRLRCALTFARSPSHSNLCLVHVSPPSLLAWVAAPEGSWWRHLPKRWLSQSLDKHHH